MIGYLKKMWRGKTCVENAASPDHGAAASATVSNATAGAVVNDARCYEEAKTWGDSLRPSSKGSDVATVVFPAAREGAEKRRPVRRAAHRPTARPL